MVKEIELSSAILEGDSKTVYTLLAQGIDANGTGSNLQDNDFCHGASPLLDGLSIVRTILASGIESTDLNAALLNACNADSSFDLLDGSQIGVQHVQELVLIIQSLLVAGADTSYKSNSWPSQTSLHRVASSLNLSALIPILVGAGADVNSTDDEGKTPLYLAAVGGYEESCHKLLGYGAYISARALNGRTPLHEASGNGTPGLVKSFLDAGADPSSISKAGETPLRFAAQSANYQIITMLLDRGAEIDARDCLGFTPFLMCVRSECLPSDDRDKIKRQIDIFSAYRANLKATTSHGWTALHLAAQSRVPGSTSLVQLLIESGLLVDALASSDPSEGFLKGGIELKEYLEMIDSSDPIVTKTTPLAWAARTGLASSIQALNAAGADVNAADSRGWTPLMLAVTGQDDLVLERVVTLLDADADPEIRNNEGITAKELAIRARFGFDWTTRKKIRVSLDSTER